MIFLCDFSQGSNVLNGSCYIGTVVDNEKLCLFCNRVLDLFGVDDAVAVTGDNFRLTFNQRRIKERTKNTVMFCGSRQDISRVNPEAIDQKIQGFGCTGGKKDSRWIRNAKKTGHIVPGLLGGEFSLCVLYAASKLT